MRILLTGATGQVGGDLLPLLQGAADVTAPSRSQLDLSDPTSIRSIVREIRPHWIINPAAYTAVDKAEHDVEMAHAINSDAPRVLGEEASRIDATVIHFSSDYVFDGSGDKPWRETDSTGPLNVYGATKLAGEQALAGTGAAHLIFRTSWVYGARGSNFLITMLRLAKERDHLPVVADQFGAPTWSFDLAKLVAHVVFSEGRLAEKSHRAQVSKTQQGIFHAVAQGETTWYGFVEEIVRLATAENGNQQWASLSPICTADYPTPARRPRNSRLDCTRLSHVFGYQLPPWQQSVAEVVGQLSEIVNGKR